MKIKLYKLYVYAISGLVLTLAYMFTNSIFKNVIIYDFNAEEQFYNTVLTTYSYIVLVIYITNFFILLVYHKVKNGLISSLVVGDFIVLSIMTLRPKYGIIFLIPSLVLCFVLVMTYSFNQDVHKKLEHDASLFKFISKPRALLIKLLGLTHIVLYIVLRIFSNSAISIDNQGGHRDVTITGIIGFYTIGYFALILLGRRYDHKRNLHSNPFKFKGSLILTILIVILNLLFVYISYT